MNTTRDILRLALGVTMSLAALALVRTEASAQVPPPRGGTSTAMGTLTSVGTFPWNSSSVPFFAQVRVRMDGKCDGTDEHDLYIIIRSGSLQRGTDWAEANGLSMKNAYSTLLTALLSANTVEIHGLQSCNRNARGEVFLDLPNADVSILK
jgi:hypothetical protein